MTITSLSWSHWPFLYILHPFSHSIFISFDIFEIMSSTFLICSWKQNSHWRIKNTTPWANASGETRPLYTVQGVREMRYNFDRPANRSKLKYHVWIFCIVWRKVCGFIKYAYRHRRTVVISNNTGHFKTNRTHCFTFKIRTVHSIYRNFLGHHIPSMHGISYQFHHHILKIVEMRALFQKVLKVWNHVLIDKKYTFFIFEFFMKFLNISNSNWDTTKYYSFKGAPLA